MRERLGEVAEVAARRRVEFLGVEAEGRGDPQQAFHQVACRLLLADDRERRDEPEGADQERPLLARKPVVGLVGPVPQDEAVLGEVVRDRQHRRVQGRVVVGKEAEDRREQRRRVERIGLVVLAKHAVAGAVLEDVGPDLLGGRAPLLLQAGIASDLRQLGRAVERDPAHELRGDVLLRLPARLPDPLVRVAPDLRRALCLGLHDRPEAARQARAVPGVEEDRVEDRAEDVVLPLVEGTVADPHGRSAGVAAELVTCRLVQVAPAVDAVHDLERAVLGRLEVADELHELARLPVQIEEVERLEGERRVPDPGVAVVPVPLAARCLGERGRERGHGRARRHVGQALDRQRRALNRVAQTVIRDPRAAQPPAPEARRRVDPRRRLAVILRSSELLGPGQGAVRALAGLEDVVCADRLALDVDREIGDQPESHAGARGVDGVVHSFDRRPGRRRRAVVEGGLAHELDLHVAF